MMSCNPLLALTIALAAVSRSAAQFPGQPGFPQQQPGGFPQQGFPQQQGGFPQQGFPQQGFPQQPQQQFAGQFAPQPQFQQPQFQQPQFQQPQQFAPPPQQQFAPQQQPGAPQINWGQCPQLEPTVTEKMKKAAVITKCLEVTSIPQNVTRESVERHREQVAACALQMEGWFTPEVTYRYEKAETEIKGKRLPGAVEAKVLQYHSQCKAEAEEKYPSSTKNIIQQIQLYQACMDYFISEACGIEVTMPQQPPPQQFQPQPQGFQRFQ